MSFVSKVIRQIQNKGLLDSASLSFHIACGLMDFYLNPWSKDSSKLPPPKYEKIKRELEMNGIKVVPYEIIVDDFYKWLSEADFPKDYVDYYRDVFVEKALEHYVGARLLGLQNDDVFIDVAAARSPWFEISERMYGCKSYALDVAYPKGVDGKKIGADATSMHLPGGFASKMSLHCSYEMFEKDADMRFLQEAFRGLKAGGKMLILPLYMHNSYFAESSPWADRRGLDYQGMEKVWRNDGYGARFARMYSVDAFMKRVVNNLNGFNLKIYYIENEKDVSPACYLKFAAMFEKGS